MSLLLRPKYSQPDKTWLLDWCHYVLNNFPLTNWLRSRSVHKHLLRWSSFLRSSITSSQRSIVGNFAFQSYQHLWGKMTRGEKVCAFIEQYCLIPEGAQVGQPIKLMKFQKQFILDVYDNPHGTRRAYLSVASATATSKWIRVQLICMNFLSWVHCGHSTIYAANHTLWAVLRARIRRL